MGARGPAPKPTSIKIAAGNPGKRKLNDGEPLPPPGDIRPPSWLSKRALKVWAEAAPACIAMRTLTTADVHTFGRYCTVFARWLLIQKKLDHADDDKAFAATAFVVKGESGAVRYMAPLPQAVELRQLHQQLKDLEDRFGLNAAARSRIRIGISGAGPAGDAPSVTAAAPGARLAAHLHANGTFKIAEHRPA